ncbi:GIY-YIG nuclease family protein [Patescibacteria group bacterium]|nr:GIY-YIG nuclease family protein [Patescibacteria group bacterium]
MFTYVYIIQNAQRDLYVGLTTDLRRRIGEHNAGKNYSTKNRGQWKLIFYKAYCDIDDATRREKYLKTNQGARLLKRMLKEYLYKQKQKI